MAPDIASRAARKPVGCPQGSSRRRGFDARQNIAGLRHAFGYRMRYQLQERVSFAARVSRAPSQSDIQRCATSQPDQR